MQEWQSAQSRQNAALDRIADGVQALGTLARDMGDEMKKHDPMIDEIDAGLDRANTQLRSNNAKLDKLITGLRSKRNFWCDLFLICVILGIAGYIFSLVSK